VTCPVDITVSADRATRDESSGRRVFFDANAFDDRDITLAVENLTGDRRMNDSLPSGDDFRPVRRRAGTAVGLQALPCACPSPTTPLAASRSPA
jgi:hypothetical protein